MSRKFSLIQWLSFIHGLNNSNYSKNLKVFFVIQVVLTMELKREQNNRPIPVIHSLIIYFSWYNILHWSIITSISLRFQVGGLSEMFHADEDVYNAVITADLLSSKRNLSNPSSQSSNGLEDLSPPADRKLHKSRKKQRRDNVNNGTFQFCC